MFLHEPLRNNKFMMKEEKIKFLEASIKDIQDTIRALDRKMFGTLVLLLLPITQITNVVGALKMVLERCHCLGVLLIFVAVLIWLWGFINSCLGILSMGNPANHIKKLNGKDSIKVNGYFYNPGFYNINIFQSIFSNSISSRKTLEEYIEDLNTDWDISNELIFEQAKLAFIRDLKIQRQRNALIAILIVGITIGILIVLKHCSI